MIVLDSLRRAGAATCTVLGVGALVPGLSADSSPAAAQSRPLYYNIADDPDGLQLIDLESIRGKAAATEVEVIDLFRGAARHGLITTWQINCPLHRMQIVRAASFAPGEKPYDRPIKSESVRSGATRASRTIHDLACNGEGQLVERRVYYDQLSAIIDDFWGSN